MKMSDPTQVLTHRNRVHPTDLFRRLNKLRHEELLCDLTIVVQGQKFKAHKVVMAACSNYFMSAILGGKSTASVSITDSATGSNMSVELQYVTIRGFTPLLDYAYTSELIVNASDVIDVLAAASYMQMFDVSAACSNFVRTTLKDPSNPARLPFWYNHSTNVAIDKTKNLSNSENEKSNDVSENLNSLFQAAVNFNRSEPHYNSVPLLAQPSMLFPLSPLHTFDAHLPHRSGGPIMSGGAQHLLSHFLNKQSSPTTSPSTSSAFLPPSSPIKVNESSPELNTIQNDHKPLNTQTEIHSSGSHHNADKYITPEISPRKNRPFNIVDSARDSEKNLESNFDESNDEPIPLATRPKPLKDDNIVSTLTAQSPEKQQRDNPLNDNKDTWQQKFLTNNASVTLSGSSHEALVKNDVQGYKDAMQSSSNPSLTENLNSSIRSQAAFSTPFPLSMISGLNGLTFHQQLLQRHLLAQQHQHYQQTQQHPQPIEKTNSDIPAMPSNGHYTSVRRRTLQSNVPKPHQCQICGSRFTRYHNLKQHIKLHSGVKPYECDMCRKRFTRNYTLRLHKMKHVGIRNFRCGTCAAAFTSLGEFRAHLRLTMHSHMPPAADDENPLRKMGEQTEQKFERSQFGVGLPRSKKCEFDVERSGKLASTDSGNRHVFNGVECPTLSSLPAPTIRDISAKQRSSRDCIDQVSPPLKKRSCEETEIRTYEIHSDGSDIMKSTT